MKEELSDLIVLCEQASETAFQNGVVHDGIDEGDVVAAKFIARAKTALAREDAVMSSGEHKETEEERASRLPMTLESYAKWYNNYPGHACDSGLVEILRFAAKMLLPKHRRYIIRLVRHSGGIRYVSNSKNRPGFDSTPVRKCAFIYDEQDQNSFSSLVGFMEMLNKAWLSYRSIVIEDADTHESLPDFNAARRYYELYSSSKRAMIHDLS